jgi:murein DD-endopeptidase MepM/ murein hydrolase activator NlpD
MEPTRVTVDRPEPPSWFRAGSRVRGVGTFAGLLGMVTGLGAWLVLPDDLVPDAVLLVLCLGGFVLLMVGTALTLAPVTPAMAARPVGPPVSGRWSALNSPATRVPSHGTHGLGQSFAIDVVYEPEEGARPAFGEGRAFRRPEEFPAFGQELVAPADGRVVAVHDRRRDHRSRSTWPAVAYMTVEAMLREAAGSRYVLGNHVVMDLGDGVYATLAHLQRGSVVVQPGQQLRRGEVVGRCGNSGNTSEPHLHFQLMDHPRPFVAAGLPFVFTEVGIDGSARREGVPADGQVMIA